MLLAGKKGLVLNVTNKNSIGWAVAERVAALGAEVGVGAQNEKMLDKVNELIAGNDRMKSFVVDFSDDAQMEALAAAAKDAYGHLDFVVHSAAFAKREDLAGLEPILADDASIVTMSYLGSVRAVGNYNVMGVAKAALESAVRYLANDLGERGIRVNTVSPGPINTISARGVRGLTDMIKEVHDVAPLKREFGQDEVAGTTAYLVSDLSKGVTGQLIYVDSGYNIMGI